MTKSNRVMKNVKCILLLKIYNLLENIWIWIWTVTDKMVDGKFSRRIIAPLFFSIMFSWYWKWSRRKPKQVWKRIHGVLIFWIQISLYVLVNNFNIWTKKDVEFDFSSKVVKVSLCLMNHWVVCMFLIFEMIIRRVNLEQHHRKVFFPTSKGGKKLLTSSILKRYLTQRQSNAYVWWRDVTKHSTSSM